MAESGRSKQDVIADAVVLGGGTVELGAQQFVKGLLDINGRPMLEYAARALGNASLVGKIAVVLPRGRAEGDWTRFVDEVAESSGGLPEGIRAGTEVLRTDRMLLVVSADIPLLTPDALDDFLERCFGQSARVYYPIIERESVRHRFPDVKRTYVRMREGSFTGGNLALVDPRVVKENMSLFETAYDLRKSPLGLARVLGFGFMLRFVLGRLSIAQAERRVSAMLGAECRAVITPYAEIGVDVDKGSDLELVRRVLAEVT